MFVHVHNNIIYLSLCVSAGNKQLIILYRMWYCIQYLYNITFPFYGCIILIIGYFSDKQYASADEEDSRKDAFIANHKSITIHNYLHAKGLSTYTMGINQFTDMVR